MDRTILVIDDNKEIRENTAEILELAGYKTLTAENGKKGVEVAVNQKPALIICDIMMPEIDGFHLLEILRGKSTFEKNSLYFFYRFRRAIRDQKRTGGRRQ